MTLNTLIFAFATIGLLLTYIFGKWVKKPDHWWLSFLKNFVGVWFIFSGSGRFNRAGAKNYIIKIRS